MQYTFFENERRPIMASGEGHDQTTMAGAGLIIAAAVVAPQSLSIIFSVAIGFLAGGMLFSPDLDGKDHKPTKRWGILRYIWFPLWVLGHRSWLSHGWLIGSLFRAVWFYGVVCLPLWFVILNISELVQVLWPYALALLFGQVLGGEWHLLVDLFTTQSPLVRGSQQERAADWCPLRMWVLVAEFKGDVYPLLRRCRREIACEYPLEPTETELMRCVACQIGDELLRSADERDIKDGLYFGRGDDRIELCFPRIKWLPVVAAAVPRINAALVNFVEPVPQPPADVLDRKLPAERRRDDMLAKIRCVGSMGEPRRDPVVSERQISGGWFFFESGNEHIESKLSQLAGCLPASHTIHLVMGQRRNRMVIHDLNSLVYVRDCSLDERSPNNHSRVLYLEMSLHTSTDSLAGKIQRKPYSCESFVQHRHTCSLKAITNACISPRKSPYAPLRRCSSTTSSLRITNDTSIMLHVLLSIFFASRMCACSRKLHKSKPMPYAEYVCTNIVKESCYDIVC